MKKLITVRDHIPLKQGLRPRNQPAKRVAHEGCPRPYSIKTRIKTQPRKESTTLHSLRPRPYSIKTRIKTPAQNTMIPSMMSETIFH